AILFILASMIGELRTPSPGIVRCLRQGGAEAPFDNNVRPCDYFPGATLRFFPPSGCCQLTECSSVRDAVRWVRTVASIKHPCAVDVVGDSYKKEKAKKNTFCSGTVCVSPDAPAQCRTGGSPLYGSHLGCVKAKRSLRQDEG